MTYQVLARKWRPQDFSSLVGQGPIVTALRNGLTEGRIAQAYLFSGIRGVGKTTTARLLAKALNCERGPAEGPCNECQPCLEITRGSDMDVIEVDAATYSKVEQVRELAESLRYGPARDRYKVVVIDEIHRLSRQAFDALLKIVEEPPPHLVFIFATTEIEAVPATILSRCQEFRFRRVPVAEMAAHLRSIGAAEQIEVSDAALRLIARAGEGSVRDSVALLDQLATFGAGAIRDEDAARLSGSLDASLFVALLGGVLSGQVSEVSSLARRIEEEGWDARHVYSQFLSFCRDGLHLAMGGEPGTVDLPAEDAQALAEVASRAGYENLLRLLQQLLASEETVRRSEAGSLALEIAWLRAAELPKLVRVEEILAGGAATSAAAPGARGAAAPPAPPLARSSARPAAAPEVGETRQEPRRPAPAAPAPPESPTPEGPRPENARPENARPENARPENARPENARPEDAAPGLSPDSSRGPSAENSPARGPRGGSVSALKEEISRRKPSLNGHLETAEKIVLEDGVLLIYLSPGSGGDLARQALERAASRQILDAAVAAVWGPEIRWRALPGKGDTTPAGGEGSRAETVAGVEDLSSHPTVQAVLDIFGGTVETIAPRPSEQED